MFSKQSYTPSLTLLALPGRHSFHLSVKLLGILQNPSSNSWLLESLLSEHPILCSLVASPTLNLSHLYICPLLGCEHYATKLISLTLRCENWNNSESSLSTGP